MAGQLRAALEAQARRAAARLPARMVAEARKTVPVDTGELFDSITASSTLRGNSLVVVVESPLVQAATTNSGARPHVITPRRARVLRFRTGGRVVYARRVNHPGNAGTHWFDRAMAQWGRAVSDELGG